MKGPCGEVSSSVNYKNVFGVSEALCGSPSIPLFSAGVRVLIGGLQISVVLAGGPRSAKWLSQEKMAGSLPAVKYMSSEILMFSQTAYTNFRSLYLESN